MRCKVHPDRFAVATCMSCGKGICPTCRIVFEGVPHCKECIESGNYRPKDSAKEEQQYPQPDAWPEAEPQQYAQEQYAQPQHEVPEYGAPEYNAPQHEQQNERPAYDVNYSDYETEPETQRSSRIPAMPKPAGEPTRMFFKAGAAGAMLGGFGAIVSAIFFYMWDLALSENQYSDPATFAIGSGTILSVGAAITMIGFYGFYVNYGFRYALPFGGIFLASGIIYFVIMPLGIRVSVTNPGYGAAQSQYSLDMMTVYYAVLILGIGYILGGVSLLALRKYHLSVKIPVASGAIMIIGGFLFCGYIGVLVIGWLFIAVSFFMLSYLFATAPIPVSAAGTRADLGEDYRREPYPQEQPQAQAPAVEETYAPGYTPHFWGSGSDSHAKAQSHDRFRKPWRNPVAEQAPAEPQPKARPSGSGQPTARSRFGKPGSKSKISDESPAKQRGPPEEIPDVRAGDFPYLKSSSTPRKSAEKSAEDTAYPPAQPPNSREEYHYASQTQPQSYYPPPRQHSVYAGASSAPQSIPEVELGKYPYLKKTPGQSPSGFAGSAANETAPEVKAEVKAEKYRYLRAKKKKEDEKKAGD